jgi:cytochrome c
MKAFIVQLLCLISMGAHAASPESPVVVQALKLLDEAAAEVGAVGTEAAARNFTAGGKWHAGSTYVVINDFKGTVLAHSVNPKMVGKVMREAKDAAGKQFVAEALVNMKKSGYSRVYFRWANPDTKKFADAQMISKLVPGPDRDKVYVSVVLFP